MCLTSRHSQFRRWVSNALRKTGYLPNFLTAIGSPTTLPMRRDDVSGTLLTDDSPSSVVEAPEKSRFEGRGAFATILIFAVGPLMFNTGISIHDAVDFVWISSVFESQALQIVGFASLVRFLCLSVAIYYAQACITKVSGLIGENRRDEAALVVTDLFRLSILTMIVVPFGFYFAAKPLLIFLGCDDEQANEGREYLLPVLIAMPLISTFQTACGCLQSEGRSVLCGAMQFVGFALNCGLFAPIMLKVVKVTLPFAGVSFALSQSLVGIGLTITIYRGKFGLKPRWRDWIGPFHRESFHAMLLALPFLINVLANSLPPMIVLKLVMHRATSEGVADVVGVVFPVFIKLNSAINSVSTGLCQGFLGAGSYAFSSRNALRHLHLFRAVCVLGFCYHLALMPIMVFKPQWPSRIWLSDTTQLEWARRLIRIPYFTNSLIPLNFAMINFLLSTKSPMISLLLTLVRGGLYVGYSFLCYYVLKRTTENMMHAYNMDDGTLFVLGLICLTGPFRKVWKMSRLSPFESLESLPAAK